MSANDRIRIGVSSCLLGENVRYDGGHKRDRYITDILGPYVEWIPVCPELEVGMGVPRESVRLVGDPEAPRMRGSRTAADWTDRMNRYARKRAGVLASQELDGYILKSKSPSCGLQRVKIYTEAGMPSASGPGLYARELLARHPTLPIEEDGRLNDPAIREQFIVRIFCRRRWRLLRAARFRRGLLVDFHARHKFLLMAHSEKHLRELGRLTAAARERKPSELLDAYETLFFEALKRPATRKRHVNVLQHIAGFFRDELDAAARRELSDVIAQYADGHVPLIVPITLLRHHLLMTGQAYLRDQVYLSPHPRELMLLNHV